MEGDVELIGEDDFEFREGGLEEVLIKLLELMKVVKHFLEGGFLEDVVNNIFKNLTHHIIFYN